MNKLLEQAIKEAAALPEDQQEELAARLLDEVRERAVSAPPWTVSLTRLSATSTRAAVSARSRASTSSRPRSIRYELPTGGRPTRRG
jgi:hypothetical protein